MLLGRCGMIDNKFWSNKNVLITGSTGFKGSWLSLLLLKLDALVTGFSLPPPTVPSLFDLVDLEGIYSFNQTVGDIRNLPRIKHVFDSVKPEIVFHLAAQPLVIDSYDKPVYTFETNTLGTVNVLEACRTTPSVKSIVIITTDKVYHDKQWPWPYRENDTLGGYDPYAASKAASEIVTDSYRNSFFKKDKFVATARSGNVLGGGDWAKNRLIPDCVKAVLSGEPITLRHLRAVRPWQFVLDPLIGYLMLAEKLYDNECFADSWNFGPNDDQYLETLDLVEKFMDYWVEANGHPVPIKAEELPHTTHETEILKLDSTKARSKLGWKSVTDINKTIKNVIDFTVAFKYNKDVFEVCTNQIEETLDAYR
jgi:CDP-glucose 4,6-dehydratase